MAYVPANGDIIRVTIAATFPDSQIQENNLNYVITSAGGTDFRPTLGPSVYALFLANWLNSMSYDSSMYGWKVAVVNRSPNPVPASAVATNVGSISAHPCPTQARPILSWQTANGGRGYRGRLFLFTPSSNAVSATGYLDTTPAAASAALAAALLPPITAGGTTLQLVIAHRHKGPPVTWTVDPVTAAIARVKIGTQRKSGNYGRTNVGPW